MFNRKYKKGMADAAKAYEAFGKKQEEALQHILEEVRQGKKDMETALKELNGNIDDLYNHLKSKEKAQLYTVYTPFDIKNLGEQEKLFLVGALYRLTMDKAPNENQQNYLRAIQKYLEIKDPPFGTDPMAIENIEDIPTQKAILQAVLEFLSLQDGDSYDETELQQNFLDAFSVNARGRQEIMDHIELLYTATGAKGLAEKYGYVPEEELFEDSEDSGTIDDISTLNNTLSRNSGDDWNYEELTEDQVADIYDAAPFIQSKSNVWYAVLCETQNYYIYSETKNKTPSNRSIKSFNKNTFEVKDITEVFSGFYGAEAQKLYVCGGGELFPHHYDAIQSLYIWKDILIYDDSYNEIWSFDLQTNEKQHITAGLLPQLLPKKISCRGGFLETRWIPFLKDTKLYVINSSTKEIYPIRYNGITVTEAFSVTGYRNYITFFADIPSEENTCLCCFNTDTQKTTILWGAKTEQEQGKNWLLNFLPLCSGQWHTGGLYSINDGTVCYEHIRGDCVEVLAISFKAEIPTTTLYTFEFQTHNGIGTQFFIDKDFLGFITAEGGKIIYKYSATDNTFICIAKGCGGASSFDRRIYRIGRYLYMEGFSQEYSYRISVDQSNQKKVYL